MLASIIPTFQSHDQEALDRLGQVPLLVTRKAGWLSDGAKELPKYLVYKLNIGDEYECQLKNWHPNQNETSLSYQKILRFENTVLIYSGKWFINIILYIEKRGVELIYQPEGS